MVTPMTEQPGQQDPAGRPPRENTPRPPRESTARPDRAGQGGQKQNLPGSELLTDFQRWLLRSSAKSMRKELTGQVRKTLGGGRPDNTDVWDVATTEIPPEVGESPECQWCPVCRAARRMRDSGPGLGGQLSGAGDVVASAASDVISMIDSLLSRTGGTAAQRDRDGGPAGSGPAGSGPAGSGPAGSGPAGRGPAGSAAGPASSDAARDDDSAATGAPAAADDPGTPLISAADTAERDPWSEATAADSDGGPAGPSGEGAHESDDRG
jgi:hypothetical protein